MHQSGLHHQGQVTYSFHKLTHTIIDLEYLHSGIALQSELVKQTQKHSPGFSQPSCTYLHQFICCWKSSDWSCQLSAQVEEGRHDGEVSVVEVTAFSYEVIHGQWAQVEDQTDICLDRQDHWGDSLQKDRLCHQLRVLLGHRCCNFSYSRGW